MYDGKWWIGGVIKLYDNDTVLKVKFMHPSGPSIGFKWPGPEDELRVPNLPIFDVLSVIDEPVTRNGRNTRCLL